MCVENISEGCSIVDGALSDERNTIRKRSSFLSQAMPMDCCCCSVLNKFQARNVFSKILGKFSPFHSEHLRQQYHFYKLELMDLEVDGSPIESLFQRHPPLYTAHENTEIDLLLNNYCKHLQEQGKKKLRKILLTRFNF